MDEPRIGEVLNINDSEAGVINAAVDQIADPENLGKQTALEVTPLPARSALERVEINRRGLLTVAGWVFSRMAASVGGVARTAGGVAGTAFAIDHFGEDHLTDIGPIDARLNGTNLDEDFIRYIGEWRHAEHRPKNLVAAVHEHLPYLATSERHTFVASMIKEFDDGKYANKEHLNALENLFFHCSKINSKLFLGDHIIGEHTRAGNGSLAKNILRPFLAEKLPSDSRLVILEKIFSIHYTTLRREDYLNRYAWGFEPGFALFNEVVGDAIKMKITKLNEKMYRIDSTPSFGTTDVRDFAKTFKPPGFYSLFWAIHYFVATHDRKERSEALDLQYHLLKSFAPHFQRAVWNALAITCFQLTRLDDRSQRKRFLDAAVGNDPRFWPPPTDILADFHKRAQNLDMVPLCFLMLLLSDTHIRQHVKLWDAFKLDFLIFKRDQVPAQRIRCALDQARRLAGQTLDGIEKYVNCLAGDNTRGVYLPDFEDIRAGLSKW